MTHTVGDLVVMSDDVARPQDRGVIYKVTKVLKVNIVVEPCNGGRALRGNPALFDPAPADAVEALIAGRAVVETVPYLELLTVGQVVTIAGRGWKRPAGELYVVIQHKRDDRVKVAKLGGDDGRYFPGVPRAMLTVVEPARLTLSA